MGPKPYLSQDKISRIYALQKAGFGPKAIVEQTGVAQRTVERWIARCRASSGDEPPHHLPKSGRPRKCSPKTIKVLKRQSKASPKKTARQFKEENPRLLSDVSVRTVQRMLLRDMDLPSRSAARKPLLTAHHKANRLAFAKAHKDWPLDKIRRILWSDESVFTVSGTKHGKVRRPRGADRYDPQYTVKTVKHPDSIMVWGCFSYYGVGNLVFLEKGVAMNAERYLDLLFDNLEECYDKCNAETFMQDGAPCHTSKHVKEWLNNCAIEYFTDWPGNSPDLNPIENLWSIMKKKVQCMDTSSVPKLKAALVQVWQEFPLEQLQSLADSVPRRFMEVIKKKGNTTKY